MFWSVSIVRLAALLVQVAAVIVAPTRELAEQIFHVAEPFILRVAHASCALLVGGR